VAELIAAAAERYALAHTTSLTGALAAAAEWTQANAESPQMMSGLAEVRLLEALVVLSGARTVLEIGTFTGVGSLAIAAALPDGGRLITLERDPRHAACARRHIASSPHPERIELIEGNALQTLGMLPGPFDLVYIDAWKADYPAYLDAVLPKLAPGGAILADNLFRDRAVLAPSAEHDEDTRGIREFARRVQADERLHNVLLTVGDGLMLAWPRPPM
jgi:caffeoyl-CoA O-methyltransferase